MINETDINYNHLLSSRKLRFPDKIEKLFQDDYYKKSIGMVRIALLMGIILYAVFGILDLFMAGDKKFDIWFIRFVIVCPLLVFTLLISFSSIFKKIMQPSLAIVSSAAGIGILAMIELTKNSEGALLYYAGLILVIMWCFTFVKLRFIYATIVCWIFVFIYEFMSIFSHDMLHSNRLLNIFISNNFFFISAIVIGMFAGYLIELYTRKDFLHRLIISQNEKKMEIERNELKRTNDIMNKELNMARIIQQELLPTKMPNDSIYSFYKPMEAVGGDLYDFIDFKDNKRIGIFLSDVVGHGVPAALITTMLKTLILETSRFKENPAKFLSHINEQMVKITGENFVTIFYGIYNYSTHTMIYSNAGHMPPYIITDEKILKFSNAMSLPVGIMNNAEMIQLKKEYTNRKRTLPGNSKIFFYTDGLLEASRLNDRNNNFEKIIDNIMMKIKDFSPIDFVNKIYHELVSFRGNDSFDDDICMICINVQ